MPQSTTQHSLFNPTLPNPRVSFFFFNLREISEIDETHQMKNCGAIPHHGTEGFLKGFHENRTKKVESLS